MRVEADPRQGIDAARLIRHVYDAVACGIIVRDGGGTLVHANDAALRMFGATRDQIVGQPLLGGVADGTDVWLLGEAVPVMGADGEPAIIVTSFMDVTAERRAQAERHEAEARLRAAVATSPVMLFVLDRDGRFLLSEGGALKRLGLAPGETIGRSAIEMYANVPAIVWSIERALEGEAVKTKVDLGGVAFDVDYAPLRDARGETYSVVGLAVDVTERSRAERHLKTVHAVTRVIAGASRHRDVRQEILRTLGESFRWDAAVFWRVDAARNVMHVRETWQSDGADLDAWFAACRSRELRKGEGLPGRVWASATSAWISDVSVEPGFTRAQAATDARLHTVLCFPIRHGDRVFAAIEFWSREVRREVDHDLFAVLEAVADQIGGFVARRTVQLQLQASEARLRGIIDSALDAVVTLDETGRITEWSPGAETLFGWTREEAMGHRLTENIIPERYRGRHEAALARFLATGERTILGRRIEIEAQHRDGHELPVELTVSATRSEGGWVFMKRVSGSSQRTPPTSLRGSIPTVAACTSRPPRGRSSATSRTSCSAPGWRTSSIPTTRPTHSRRSARAPPTAARAASRSACAARTAPSYGSSSRRAPCATSRARSSRSSRRHATSRSACAPRRRSRIRRCTTRSPASRTARSSRTVSSRRCSRRDATGRRSPCSSPTSTASRK
ncbi:MAG: PAS domain S-box protein [Chloroflexi bacterium]|nr:MAG: PAS domain S-box protein [Chloroflexota bacterium]